MTTSDYTTDATSASDRVAELEFRIEREQSWLTRMVIDGDAWPDVCEQYRDRAQELIDADVEDQVPDWDGDPEALLPAMEKLYRATCELNIEIRDANDKVGQHKVANYEKAAQKLSQPAAISPVGENEEFSRWAYETYPELYTQAMTGDIEARNQLTDEWMRRRKIEQEAEKIRIREAARKLVAEEAESADARDDGKPMYADLAALLSGDLPEPPQPAFGTRRDGRKLFYPAAVNMLYAMPEQGKTWVTLLAVVEALRAGKRVGWADADHNGPAALMARLMPIDGVTAEMVTSGLVLADPESPAEMDAFTADMIAWGADLVIIDSIGEVMTLHGADNNVATDYLAVNRRHAAKLSRAGACVVIVDHLNRQGTDADTSSGTLAKKNALDGVQVQLRGGSFEEGRGGRVNLVITKDRHGQVRKGNPKAGSGQNLFGQLRLGIPDMDGNTALWIDMPEVASNDGDRRAQQEMELANGVPGAVDSLGRPSYRSLRDAVEKRHGVTRSAAERAIKAAEDSGLVTVSEGARGAKVYSVAGTPQMGLE